MELSDISILTSSQERGTSSIKWQLIVSSTLQLPLIKVGKTSGRRSTIFLFFFFFGCRYGGWWSRKGNFRLGKLLLLLLLPMLEKRLIEEREGERKRLVDGQLTKKISINQKAISLQHVVLVAVPSQPATADGHWLPPPLTQKRILVPE